ncbi:MAG: lamin tail domain-containing protein, partial [Chloroflexi bacterium]|nr:lamin tail domain-containing protein [Chloroflexota bacterium]
MLPIQARAQNLIISEIMYHPPSTNRLEEWFEVFNAGTDTLDLSGWRVSKGVSFAFATNTTLAPQGYLAVAAHGPTFSSQHPGVS